MSLTVQSLSLALHYPICHGFLLSIKPTGIEIQSIFMPECMQSIFMGFKDEKLHECKLCKASDANVARSKSCAFPAFLTLRNKVSKRKDARQRVKGHILDSLKWQYAAKRFINSL
jgi:signal transduction histidine kinase